MAKSEESQVMTHRFLQWVITVVTTLATIMLGIITFFLLRFFDQFDDYMKKVDVHEQAISTLQLRSSWMAEKNGEQQAELDQHERRITFLEK